ncbi:hypothetical protein B7486_48845 [cyanobacterium TDX16]|nr:hypothetical protein B7486_48845 [cyanobacterium TDX16]
MNNSKLILLCCVLILSIILPFSCASADSKTRMLQRGDRNVIFGANNGTGYDDSREFSQMVSKRISALGLTAVRTGADKMKCEREGEPCDFSRRDVVIQEHLAKGLALHMVIAFRWELDVAGYSRPVDEELRLEMRSSGSPLEGYGALLHSRLVGK